MAITSIHHLQRRISRPSRTAKDIQTIQEEGKVQLEPELFVVVWIPVVFLEEGVLEEGVGLVGFGFFDGEFDAVLGEGADGHLRSLCMGLYVGREERGEKEKKERKPAGPLPPSRIMPQHQLIQVRLLTLYIHMRFAYQSLG